MGMIGASCQNNFHLIDRIFDIKLTRIRLEAREIRIPNKRYELTLHANSRQIFFNVVYKLTST